MSQTLQNLTKAFIGESQARNRYTFYAKTAREEGYEQVAAIFLETADQEKQHAKQLFKMINGLQQEGGTTGQEIAVEVSAPTVFATTIENLKASIAGENHEYTEMYPEFVEAAQVEGYPQIAARLRAIAKAEEHHEERYKKLLSQLEAGTVFEKEEETWWYCRECGYMHFGKRVPEKCPACDHPKAFYQLKNEQY